MKNFIRGSVFILLICDALLLVGQPDKNITEFKTPDSITVLIDAPVNYKKSKKTIIVLYALPNGNSIEQTMGKKMKPGDDWHFDIQHIAAQTSFLREQLRNQNLVVVYLQNDYKSWPTWKRLHPAYRQRIPEIVEYIDGLISARKKAIYLNGHSGGGSFIFGYLDGVNKIPSKLERISFIDSNYGYDSVYYPQLRDWLKNNPKAALNLFAYNDSVALYEGKPVVSAKGGTWYRGHLMLRHFEMEYDFKKSRDDSLIVYTGNQNRIQFYFRKNPDNKIYHTQQVELNGFIHSILCGTTLDSRNYSYYGPRVYNHLVK